MGLSGWVHNHYATKRKPCLSEFLSAKSFVVTQKHFPPGWFDWEDGFSSLTLRSVSYTHLTLPTIYSV